MKKVWLAIAGLVLIAVASTALTMFAWGKGGDIEHRIDVADHTQAGVMYAEVQAGPEGKLVDFIELDYQDGYYTSTQLDYGAPLSTGGLEAGSEVEVLADNEGVFFESSARAAESHYRTVAGVIAVLGLLGMGAMVYPLSRAMRNLGKQEASS